MDQMTAEDRLLRIEARGEIENLMGMHFHLLLANAGEEIMHQIWADTAEISVEIGASGEYRGRDKVATLYQKDHIPGKFTLLMPVTPVIQVSPKADTARGLWFAIGLETDAGELSGATSIQPERMALFSSQTEDGKRYTAEWAFQKIEAELVRAPEGWRMLHLHLYEIARTPQDSDWVKFALERFRTDGMRLDAMFQSNLPFPEDKPPENLATAPTAYHWQYTVDGLTELWPVPPVSAQ